MAGDVAARPRQAFDQTGADRVGDTYKYDRDRPGFLQQRGSVGVPRTKITSGRSATISFAISA